MRNPRSPIIKIISLITIATTIPAISIRGIIILTTGITTRGIAPTTGDLLLIRGTVLTMDRTMTLGEIPGRIPIINQAGQALSVIIGGIHITTAGVWALATVILITVTVIIMPLDIHLGIHTTDMVAAMVTLPRSLSLKTEHVIAPFMESVTLAAVR